jgi:hypothetical protein
LHLIDNAENQGNSFGAESLFYGSSEHGNFPVKTLEAKWLSVVGDESQELSCNNGKSLEKVRGRMGLGWTVPDSKDHDGSKT